MLTHGNPRTYQDDQGQYKLCADCRARFEVEYGRRGQMTSRALCTPCRDYRRSHWYRKAAALANTAGVPRCSDCSGLVGLDWGTITHLDHNKRCSDCARWAIKAAQKAISQQPASTPTTPATLETDADKPANAVAGLYGAETGKAEAMAAFHAAVAAVADAYIYTPADLLGERGTEEIAALRHGIMRALRAAGWPLQEIANATGLANHASVNCALKANGPDTLAAEAIARRYVLPFWRPIGWRPTMLRDAELRAYVRDQGGVVDVRVIAERWDILKHSAQERLRMVGLRRTVGDTYAWPEGARP